MCIAWFLVIRSRHYQPNEQHKQHIQPNSTHTSKINNTNSTHKQNNQTKHILDLYRTEGLGWSVPSAYTCHSGVSGALHVEKGDWIAYVNWQEDRFSGDPLEMVPAVVARLHVSADSENVVKETGLLPQGVLWQSYQDAPCVTYVSLRLGRPIDNGWDDCSDHASVGYLPDMPEKQLAKMTSEMEHVWRKLLRDGQLPWYQSCDGLNAWGYASRHNSKTPWSSYIHNPPKTTFGMRYGSLQDHVKDSKRFRTLEAEFESCKSGYASLRLDSSCTAFVAWWYVWHFCKYEILPKLTLPWDKRFHRWVKPHITLRKHAACTSSIES